MGDAPTCQHRAWTAADQEWPTGPLCGKPARWLNCDPIDEPSCDEHKCRCNKSIAALEAPKAQTSRPVPSAGGTAAEDRERPEWREVATCNGVAGSFEGSDPLDNADHDAAFCDCSACDNEKRAEETHRHGDELDAFEAFLERCNPTPEFPC